MLQVLPVLYVPRTLSPSFSCLSCNDGCHMDLPAFALESRCIGSHDAGWLFLARNHCEDHILWDSVNGQLIKVPDGMRFSQGGVEDPVIIHCAAISGTPKTTVPIQQCIGAALVDRIVPDLVPQVKVADVMFWSLDRTVGWGSQDFLLDVAKDGGVDVIYFNGSFHILTIGEVIIVANPRFGIHGLELKEDDIWSLGIVSAYKEDQDQVRTLEARYLVESRGGLLMVKRYRQNSSTISCRVFSLDLKGRGSAPEYDRWVWSEVIDLEGRMIFLSSGCSRSFEYRDYDQYPNAKEGFYFKGDVERLSQDWEAMNEISRLQLVSDTGLWDDPLFGRHSRCYRIPQQLPGTFPHSAPAWVLPPLF